MFTLKFANGYAFEADVVSEGIRNYADGRQVVLVVQSNTADRHDLAEMEEMMTAGVGEIAVLSDGKVIETLTSYGRVIGLNKALRPDGSWFYDLQFGLPAEDTPAG